MRKTISILSLVFLLFLFIFKLIYINPQQIIPVARTIYNSKWPKTMNGFTLIFFSDLHYRNSDYKKLNKISKIVNDVDPDLLLFGGNLLAKNTNLNKKQQTMLFDFLNRLKASQGKFAILGEADNQDERNKNKIVDILNKANFTLLDNGCTYLFSDKNESINLVGFNSDYSGKDYNFNPLDTYTITFSHYPDLYSSLPLKSDLYLAGHSLGGQIYIPLFNKLMRPKGARKYFRGQYRDNDSLIAISNGIGYKKYPLRFLAPADVLIYQFYNQQ